MKLSEDRKTWTVSGTNKDTGEDSTLHIAYARAGATDYDYAMLVNECGSSCKRHAVPLGLEGRSKFKELLAAGAPRHPIGRFRPRRPGGRGTFSNFELRAPEVAF